MGSVLSHWEPFQGRFNAAPVKAQLPNILQDPACAAVGPIWTTARNLHPLPLASDQKLRLTMKLLYGCSDLSRPVIQSYGICLWWSSSSRNATCSRTLGVRTVFWTLRLCKCATYRIWSKTFLISRLYLILRSGIFLSYCSFYSVFIRSAQGWKTRRGKKCRINPKKNVFPGKLNCIFLSLVWKAKQTWRNVDLSSCPFHRTSRQENSVAERHRPVGSISNPHFLCILSAKKF